MKRFLMAILLGSLGISTAQAAANSAEASIVQHIAAAQKNLTASERRIADERQRLVTEFNALEREVLALREKTSVARRLADEKNLSLSQLESRLDSWRQQQTYQQNLLHRFLQQYGHGVSPATAGSLSAQIKAVAKAGDYYEKQFQPRWQDADIVLKNGAVSTLPTLAIGPVTWYWNTAEEQAGMASRQKNGLLQSDLILRGGDSDVLESLRSQTRGDIVLDPTLTRALARQQNSESVFEHVVKGGLWAVPILLFALFALTIALVKVAQLWRLPKVVRFTPQALESVLRDATSPLAGTLKGMQKNLLEIARANPLPRQRDDQLFMQLQEDKHFLERWIGAIAITAAVSPLLGLLGTVSGMIETFKMMTLFGSGDPEVVSGGIAQALVTTELGLVVAIPALILNAALSRKAKHYYHDLENFAVLISKSDELSNATTEIVARTQTGSTSHGNSPSMTSTGVPA